MSIIEQVNSFDEEVDNEDNSNSQDNLDTQNRRILILEY